MSKYIIKNQLHQGQKIKWSKSDEFGLEPEQVGGWVC